MRVRLVAPLALMMLAPALAVAGGRPATETCVNAGFRAGSVAFDTCVARVGGDDPLAALEGNELSAHGDTKAEKPGEANPLAAMSPARQVVPGVVLPRQDAREELPASYNAPTVFGMPAPPPPAPPPSWPGGGGGGAPGAAPWPTPPTAPTLPSVVAPNVPLWNFGNQ